jgi:hypothetical protein
VNVISIIVGHSAPQNGHFISPLLYGIGTKTFRKLNPCRSILWAIATQAMIQIRTAIAMISHPTIAAK